MPRRYRFLGHTADVEFEAYGSSVETLFRNALLAMFDTAADVRGLARLKSPRIRFAVRAKAGSLDDLLWSALQGALSVASSRGIFGYRVFKIKVSKSREAYSVKAELLGKKASQALSKLDVKGVSKYDLSVKSAVKPMRATVVLDV